MIKPGNHHVQSQLKEIKDYIEWEKKPLFQRLMEHDTDRILELASRDRKVKFERIPYEFPND